RRQPGWSRAHGGPAGRRPDGRGRSALDLPRRRLSLVARRAAPLRRGERVHVHHGARESPARLVPLERDTREARVPGFAQLGRERPTVAVAGDPSALRRIAPPDTIGGGVVIDPEPRRHGPGELYAQRLAAIAGGDPLERLALALEDAPSGLV